MPCSTLPVTKTFKEAMRSQHSRLWGWDAGGGGWLLPLLVVVVRVPSVLLAAVAVVVGCRHGSGAVSTPSVMSFICISCLLLYRLNTRTKCDSLGLTIKVSHSSSGLAGRWPHRRRGVGAHVYCRSIVEADSSVVQQYPLQKAVENGVCSVPWSHLLVI